MYETIYWQCTETHSFAATHTLIHFRLIPWNDIQQHIDREGSGTIPQGNWALIVGLLKCFRNKCLWLKCHDTHPTSCHSSGSRMQGMRPLLPMPACPASKQKGMAFIYFTANSKYAPLLGNLDHKGECSAHTETHRKKPHTHTHMCTHTYIYTHTNCCNRGPLKKKGEKNAFSRQMFTAQRPEL